MRSSARYQRLRNYAFAIHPLCMVCGEYPAEELHHIEPADERPDLFFELSNYAPVCARRGNRCHDKVKNLKKSRNIDPDMIFPKDKRLKAEN